jgi:excisionase family DNA binding protein
MEMMTLNEAAEQLGVKPASLRQAINRGRLKATKVGSGQHGVWLVTAEQLADYLAQQPAWWKRRKQSTSK